MLQCLSTPPQPFVTQNVSEQGLQFECKVPLREGDYFRFCLTPKGAEEEIEGVACTVRAATPKGDGYEAGAQIVEISPRQSKLFRQYLDNHGHASKTTSGAK